MEYRHTSVNWPRYVRELFCEHVHTEYQNLVFEGDVEIEESLFGRKIKYNRGKPTGTRIWIFGMVETSSKRIITYTVDKRDSNTLIPLIKKQTVGPRTFLLIKPDFKCSTTKKTKPQRPRRSYQYAKSAFQYRFSSDSDFA
ncbi:Hypothetical predicted protein [Mytilus galloprovincialis]|uniref:ISXO2-like transposase domain-containing protein n=1 Tax=Mytilus galloprovincialis TaxID=29158 RepID=A0A8B6GMY5_MYTGA|nr:Hypothetical predicted protein [Mytilus galloprovincialis]